MSICVACGFQGEHDGVTHAYMSFSSACWARYGEILAREFGGVGYFQSHRRLTDAACGQHSVGTDRRARQSLHIHLAGLMLHFEDGAKDARIVNFLRNAARIKEFSQLEMPPENHLVSLADVHAAKNIEQHSSAVEDYARGVFDAWKIDHPVFRALIDRVLT